MVSPLKDKQEMLRDLDSITQTLIIQGKCQDVKFFWIYENRNHR